MRKCALSFLFAALLLAGLASGPAQAAPPTCENGVVVADPDANRGLVIDCANLLAAKTQFSAAHAAQLGRRHAHRRVGRRHPGRRAPARH